MKAGSKVQKGKRYEKRIASLIEEAGLGSARREDGSGSGLKKGDIRANIPFLIECKNDDAVPLWILHRIDQAKEQARVGWKWREKWALVFRDHRLPETKSEDYVVIDFNQFLELLKKDSEPLIKAPDRDMKWKLTTLKKVCNDVINMLE